MAKLTAHEEAADPTTPSTGDWILYFKSGGLYIIDDTGTVTGPLASADLSAYVAKSLYDANTILYATTDNTPTALTVSEQSIVGRITGGSITALTASQVKTLLALSTGDSPQFTAIELGHATDTTISRNAAGVIQVEGVVIPTVSSTDTLTHKTLTKPVINGSDPTASTYSPASGSQTVTIDCASSNMHFVQGNNSGTAITFAISNATNNQIFVVAVTQGSTTLSTIASWFSTVRWANGTIPTFTATLNKRDVFAFIRTGTNTYDGFIVGQNL